MTAWLLSYVLNALWQIPLIFLATWIVVRMSRNSGPRVEHRIWVSALLLEVVLPACNLRISTVHITDLLRTLLSLAPSHHAAGTGGVRILIGSVTSTPGALRLPFAVEAAVVAVWVCIAAYFAVRLVWGLVQTFTLARTATPFELSGDLAERWAQHYRRFALASPPRIAVSSHAIAPIAIGLRRGVVLLPPRLRETISLCDLDAVLAHELAHIARRDFAKNLLYSLLSLPAAWHPLLWRTRGRLAESRELICDEAAAAAVAGRRQYAHSLLRLASVVAGPPRLATLQAVGILDFNSNSRALERRVMTLTRKPVPIGLARRVLIAAACSVLALATCTSALALHTDISEPAQPASERHQPKKIPVSPEVIQRSKISGDDPTYPPEQRKKKIQGTVVINATISKEGAIADLHVVKTPDPSLAESALKAVRTWRYRPYLLNGNPVAVQSTINVTFCIEPCQLPGWWNHR